MTSQSEQIVALYEQGLTRMQIRLELGLTKGQVDNVIYRRDLKNPEYVGPRSGPRIRPSAPVSVVDAILPAEVSFEPPPGKLNIWNVKTFQCRFLDEEGFFCGEPAKTKSSYCDHHHTLCWVKTRRQQADASI